MPSANVSASEISVVTKLMRKAVRATGEAKPAAICAGDKCTNNPASGTAMNASSRSEATIVAARITG